MSCERGGVFGFLHDDTHLGQAEMWDFLYKYPMHYTRLPPFVEAQFLCAVAYGANEKALLTDHASLPFTNEEWEGIMDVYNDLKGRIGGPDGSYFVPSLIWHMAKTMKDVWSSRQHHHFGTIQAQTARAPMQTDITSGSSTLRMIAGILFLGAHSVYFERLQNVLLTDDLMCSREFGGLVDSLITEWENSNLLVCSVCEYAIEEAYGTDCGCTRQLYSWGKEEVL
ncbi:hypothetical protein AZE42_10554 [Rhizopogon vesiculosus]|uniref:Uncharacterized protein n=1 Tax=Rhizopogon vesiculosus TaxID=180088 RepID=A0A1J8Q0W1_9AGAM|nr:hypothetical protein AZE42_10554 [Rhizopogon vesiculosus]